MRVTRRQLLQCAAAATLAGALRPSAVFGQNGGEPLGPFSDWSEPVNLGPAVNSKFNDRHPAISPNGLSLYITSNRPGGIGDGAFNNIWVSQRASLDDAWGPPKNLGPNINTPAGANPDIPLDGRWIFFNGGKPGGPTGPADIWVSHRKDKDDDFAWEPAVNLGPAINFPGLDTNAPTFFRDEETGITSIYFNSLLRTDGPGDFDIYVSTQREDGERGFVGTFGPGVLVPELCSPRRDTRTAIRRDGLEMFITSNRAGSLPDPVSGQPSLDLWVSTRESTLDPWSTPVNLGPTVNSAAIDGGPALSRDGTTLYFYSTRLGGFGKEDLYVTTRTKLM
jgi:WD40-like Beta Propeller Repeat